MGQDACDRKTEIRIQDRWIGEQARERRDGNTLALATSGKAYDREDLLFRYGGELANATSFVALLKIGIRTPEYSLLHAWRVTANVPASIPRREFEATQTRLEERRPATTPPRISKPYSLVQMSSGQAVIVNTTLGKSKELDRLRWLPDSGYFQAHPTRIEYLDERGVPDFTIRIVMPVRTRDGHSNRTFAQPLREA